jgi:hypothetical protein
MNVYVCVSVYIYKTRPLLCGLSICALIIHTHTHIIYTYIYTWIYVCKYVCMYTYIPASRRPGRNIYINIYNLCVCVCVCVYSSAYLDLAIETTRAQEGGVQDISSVAYVSMCQHTSAYAYAGSKISALLHTSACVSMCQHVSASAYARSTISALLVSFHTSVDLYFILFILFMNHPCWFRPNH